MCDWSNWQFICEGRYDILLAALMGLALLCAVTLILLVFAGAWYRTSHPMGHAVLAARAAFLRGDGGVRPGAGKDQ